MKNSPNTCSSSMTSASSLLVLLSLALLSQECLSQTFHYSHGWTNGKRSGGAASAAAAAPRMARIAQESVSLSLLFYAKVNGWDGTDYFEP